MDKTTIQWNNYHSHSLITRPLTNDASNTAADTENEPPPMNHLYEEWILEHDKRLYENRNMSPPQLASMLGRGLRGVQSRLDKLEDVNSSAYLRLFVSPNHHDDNDDNQSKNKTKQTSLTPAGEILRRIRWDVTLTPSDFSILHYDRVQDQINECQFDDPNTSVKGREELFVFAIPEHRIMAVKYRERVVWDKEARLDCVFGSMNGNGERIDQVIANYNEWKEQKDYEEEQSRLRQQDITQRMKFILGNERFDALKERSGILMNTNEEDNGNIKGEIQQYVKFVLGLFRDAANANTDNENETQFYSAPFLETEMTHVDTSNTNKQYDLESMYLFSELVAFLPKEYLRIIILGEVEATIFGLQGKKQNVTLKRKVLPELNEEDLEEKFVRGSGNGGQKVNKTSNKVNLLHIPTNIRVECQETRSLHQNRKIARKRLQLKLDEFLNGDQSKTSLLAAKAAKKKLKRKSKSKANKAKQENMENAIEYNE